MQGKGQTALSDDWYGTSWCCECDYSNVGTDRCYYCGSLAPRDLRARLASTPAAGPGADAEGD